MAHIPMNVIQIVRDYSVNLEMVEYCKTVMYESDLCELEVPKNIPGALDALS
jgi:hypothetical protein